VSYSALLHSLASTPKGDDDWRTIFGTLLRQAYNDGARFKPRAAKPSGESQRQEARRRGVSLYRVRVDRGASTGKGSHIANRDTRMVSATRIAADLRSVGWGGADAQVRQAYDVMQTVFTLPPSRESQARGDLVNFNAKPPAGWQKTERGTADRYVSHATVVVIPIGDSSPRVRLWGSNTKYLPTVYGALVDIRQAYDQDKPMDEETEYAETVITYEYAGVRHIVKS
jgi:hypothetical protein